MYVIETRDGKRENAFIEGYTCVRDRDPRWGERECIHRGVYMCT